MKKIFELLCFLLLLSPLVSAQTPSTNLRPLALTHVTVIDTTGGPAQRDMTVVIRGDRIAAVARAPRFAFRRAARSCALKELSMKKSFALLCFVFLLASRVSTQTSSTNQNATRVYPDFALQPPTINTNPGPEYASWTRMYQGIPGIERTAKGRLWAGWTAGGMEEGPMNYVVLVTSTDDGKTWSEPKLVIQLGRTVWAFGPGLWYDPCGHLWLFWMQSNGHHDGREGVWAIVSDDPDSESPGWSTESRIIQ